MIRPPNIHFISCQHFMPSLLSRRAEFFIPDNELREERREERVAMRYQSTAAKCLSFIASLLYRLVVIFSCSRKLPHIMVNNIYLRAPEPPQQLYVSRTFYMLPRSMAFAPFLGRPFLITSSRLFLSLLHTFSLTFRRRSHY